MLLPMSRLLRFRVPAVNSKMTTPVTDPQPGKLYSDDNASIGVDPKRITADNTKTSDDAQTPDTKPFARLTNDNVSKSDAQEQPPAPLPVSSSS